jgi:hypothetical protein
VTGKLADRRVDRLGDAHRRTPRNPIFRCPRAG